MPRVLLLMLFPVVLLAQSRTEQPVAIIALLTGPATLKDASGPARPAHLFDWIEQGTLVETGTAGRVVLAFASGNRFEAGAAAKVTVGTEGLKSSTGPVHELTPLPPMPLAGIAPGSGASARSAAIRLRGAGSISNLYPRQGFRAQSERPILLFASDRAASYRVEVEDENGNTVFQVQTTSHKVMVPSGTLKAGMHYYWRVRAIGVGMSTARGEADFVTLTDAEDALRSAFVAALPTADAQSMALLAMVDQRLGLLAEARDELRSAVSAAADDNGLRALLSQIDLQLDDAEKTP